MGFFSKRKPEEVRIQGKQLHCQFCGNQQFYLRKTLLNTRLATIFELDWANRSASCYECAQCSFLHWFAIHK